MGYSQIYDNWRISHRGVRFATVCKFLGIQKGNIGIYQLKMKMFFLNNWYSFLCY